MKVFVPGLRAEYGRMRGRSETARRLSGCWGHVFVLNICFVWMIFWDLFWNICWTFYLCGKMHAFWMFVGWLLNTCGCCVGHFFGVLSCFFLRWKTFFVLFVKCPVATYRFWWDFEWNYVCVLSLKHLEISSLSGWKQPSACKMPVITCNYFIHVYAWLQSCWK